jgi:ATP-dependent protease ClpP protease subunit
MSDRPWNVAIRAKADDALEVAVYDVIGRDFWTGEGVTSQQFLDKLRASPKAKKIDLRVNSNGGLVDEAKAMVNLLHERAASDVEIIGWVDGVAASSAAFLLTAAKRVVMPANTFQMLHGVRGGARGTAEDLEAAAAIYRRTNEQLAEAFAAASDRRGKKKTKADYLAAFAAGDLWLNADEAIAWGLADEKLETSVKVAACLADLSEFDGAPEAIKTAPFVTLTGKAEIEPAAAIQTIPSPLPGARAEQDAPTGAGEKKMTFPKSITVALAIAEDADEAVAIAAINRLKGAAKAGTDIEALVGASGDAAVGAVRALKQANDDNAELGIKVAQLQVVNARRDFEAARDAGLAPANRKLSKAVAKLYTDRFEACLKDETTDADGRAAKANAVVADLKGFLAVAPRITSANVSEPTGSNGNSDASPMQHQGKPFEAMTGSERKRLKDENSELYASMREDAVQRGAI